MSDVPTLSMQLAQERDKNANQEATIRDYREQLAQSQASIGKLECELDANKLACAECWELLHKLAWNEVGGSYIEEIRELRDKLNPIVHGPQLPLAGWLDPDAAHQLWEKIAALTKERDGLFASLEEEQKQRIGLQLTLTSTLEKLKAAQADLARKDEALREAERLEQALRDDLSRLRNCVGFFASVIKGGEPWTETCQREYNAALYPAPALAPAAEQPTPGTVIAAETREAAQRPGNVFCGPSPEMVREQQMESFRQPFPSPEIPEGAWVSEDGKWVERVGDGVWLRENGMEWYKASPEGLYNRLVSNPKWIAVHPVGFGTPSVKGARYRLPWPPKESDDNKLALQIGRACADYVMPPKQEEQKPEPCECINWCRDGIGMLSDHHPRCKHYTPPAADPRHAVFGKSMWELIVKTGGEFCQSEWSEDVLPLAKAAGLCSRVAYDPAVHGRIDAEPGDEIWFWGEAAQSGDGKEAQ